MASASMQALRRLMKTISSLMLKEQGPCHRTV
jgi:hypothetical protein